MLKVVDAHIHWWDLDTNLYPWLNAVGEGGRDAEEANRLAKNYLEAEYLEDSKNYDVVGVVHIEAGYDPKDPVGETAWLEQQTYQLPFVTIGAANLAAENADELLGQHKQYSKIRGIRHMLNYLEGEPQFCWADQDYLNNETWRQNFSLLEKHDLIFDLMCFGHQMKPFAELAKQHPNVQVVLEHTGMPALDEESYQAWFDGVAELAQCPNIKCKLGGLGTMINHWNEQEAFKLFDRMLEVFGPERIMFASNFPTDSQYCSYDFQVKAADIWAHECLTVEQREAFFMANAIETYGLNLKNN